MLHTFSAIARSVIEFFSILIIIGGVTIATYRLVVILLHHCKAGSFSPRQERDAMIKLRISLETTLMLGLQFLMAADIIGTITDPDFQGVVILAVIVLLRIVLSIALSREVAAMDRQQRENDLHETKIKASA